MTDENNVSHAMKRTSGQKELDRKKLAEWFVQAVPYREMAERLNSVNPYSLSHVQVLKDIRIIVNQWKLDQSSMIDDRMESDLMKLLS